MATYLKEATSGKKDFFWLMSIKAGKAKWNDTICVSGSRWQCLHMVAGWEEGKVLPEPTQAQLRKARAHFGESGPLCKGSSERLIKLRTNYNLPNAATF